MSICSFDGLRPLPLSVFLNSVVICLIKGKGGRSPLWNVKCPVNHLTSLPRTRKPLVSRKKFIKQRADVKVTFLLHKENCLFTKEFKNNSPSRNLRRVTSINPLRTVWVLLWTRQKGTGLRKLKDEDIVWSSKDYLLDESVPSYYPNSNVLLDLVTILSTSNLDCVTYIGDTNFVNTFVNKSRFYTSVKESTRWSFE